jgi:hypothetical protein
MKTCISIDVGITHLSYCVLESLPGDISIKEWKVVNILDTLYPPQTLHACTSCKKNGSVCGKKAVFMDTMDPMHCFCTVHGKQQRNAHVALQPIPSQRRARKQTGKNVSMIDVCRGLTTHWTQESWIPSLTNELTITVIIEQQLTARMKMVQAMLTQYFVCLWPLCKVEYISPKWKLHGCNAPKGRSKSAYTTRKKMAVENASQWLMTHYGPVSDWTAYFENTVVTKRDDLADCLLQGLWYCNQQTGKKGK